MNSTTPEFQLLLQSAVFPLGPAEAERLDTLAKAVTHWKKFWRLVERHKVAPAVYLNLSRCAAGQVPEKLLSKLKRNYERNKSWGEILAAEFERLRQAGEGQHLPIWLLKGLTLSTELFGQSGLRVTGDLDILVPAGQIELAEQLLESLGYCRQLPARPLLPQQWRAFKVLNHHCSYFHPGNKIVAELHWSLANSYLMPNEVVGPMQSRARTISEAGFDIPALGLEDSLVCLLVHGAKHQWASLKLVVDIDAFVRSQLKVDWDLLATAMTALHLQRPLVQGFGVAARALGTPIPMAVQRVMAHEPQTTRLVEGAWQMLLAKKNYLKVRGAFTEFKQALYMAGLRPGWRYRAAYLSAFMLYSLNDWTDYPLPDRLFPLYYVMRPFTWAWRYFRPRRSESA